MVLIKDKNTLQKYLQKHRVKGKTIAFVPTMGALHQGHLSLMHEARNLADICVCSIFINPTQFNDPGDFSRYPVTIEKDISSLISSQVDVLFLPSVNELYPGGLSGLELYDLGYLESILEGQYRPGHFQGVCQVMKRLLDCVNPDKLFMGRKDFQQCLVVERLLVLEGFHIELIRVATVREKNGLAMSSRNMRLEPSDRLLASSVYQALLFIRENIVAGNLLSLKQDAFNQLKEKGFVIDYIEIADAKTLQITDEWNGDHKLVALAAVFLKDTRLIDNLLVSS